ncbi:hypothetical protein BJ742DRAFT_743742 [Cladochytrium replicatum]|nr:hypothetical protein BJ742DRAFT_743742 [Cladochytrium replicatum]
MEIQARKWITRAEFPCEEAIGIIVPMESRAIRPTESFAIENTKLTNCSTTSIHIRTPESAMESLLSRKQQNSGLRLDPAPTTNAATAFRAPRIETRAASKAEGTAEALRAELELAREEGVEVEREARKLRERLNTYENDNREYRRYRSNQTKRLSGHGLTPDHAKEQFQAQTQDVVGPNYYETF